jgi:hypothetical protein
MCVQFQSFVIISATLLTINTDTIAKLDNRPDYLDALLAGYLILDVCLYALAFVLGVSPDSKIGAVAHV